VTTRKRKNSATVEQSDNSENAGGYLRTGLPLSTVRVDKLVSAAPQGASACWSTGLPKKWAGA
jgi:hypothetical protein